jgi:hypothetical protein
VGSFILIIRTPGVEQNLLGDHVVAVKHGGENTSFLRHAAIGPNVLAFGKCLLILDSEGGIDGTSRATRVAAGANRRPQGARSASAGVTAARAWMGAGLVVPDARSAARAGVGAAHVAMAQSEGTI